MKNIFCLLGKHQWKTVGWHKTRTDLESKLRLGEIRVCTRCHAYEEKKWIKHTTPWGPRTKL